ncbi:unnamed protein product [Angiostrongylus costaricensis]|uniref:Beta-lactamase domain-containing protein n=1 Tax=Angiostrongylus costaricensis TaxID=334426 RepID=A0A0R3PMW8_ANGCS|nr:unnamed protein product [Angiostrongylus costaricensis]
MLQDDRDGASLAILWKGKVIANLYGGYADREANRLWEENTMAIAYSTTKIWAGLTAAILASRGLLYYDEKVSSFWPEFAQNGKHNITVRDVLDHRAGLITFGREFIIEEAADSKAVSALIEEAVPHWTPGSSRGYHALTYGFLIDEIVRRLDPINRTVAEIYSEEIWKEGIDFQIGSRNMDERLIARVSNPSIVESIIAHVKRPMK